MYFDFELSRAKGLVGTIYCVDGLRRYAFGSDGRGWVDRMSVTGIIPYIPDRVKHCEED